MLEREVQLNAIYSQEATAQDSWVIETLKHKRNGFFIEIGGYDGHTHSNTLALERSFDWDGLLVEANPRFFKLIRERRPACQYDDRAVSCTTGGTSQFTCSDRWSGLRGFLPPAWIRESDARKSPTCWVQTVKLFDLLREHNIPKIVDYLSLDIEGGELPVLDEFFRFGHTLFRFRCMTVEYQMDGGNLMRLERLLEPHGYSLEKVQAWDAFFVNRDLLETP